MSDGSSRHDQVVIERDFDAPVSVIWQMWTDPERFKTWYGPRGATIPIAMLDVRTGGTRRVCMEVETPGGTMQMWFTGEYREVVVNKRLLYTESMSDEHFNVRSHVESGLPEGHPITTEVRVDLDDLDGRTRMVLTHTGIPSDSPGAVGWGIALDKLADQLSAHQP